MTYFSSILYLPELQLLTTMIKKGKTLDESEVDSRGRTPLMLACEKRLHDVAKFLLTAKKDRKYIISTEQIDEKNPSKSKNALSISIDKKMDNIARLIIQRGATVDCKLKGQSTLLIRALENKLPDVAEAIIRKGQEDKILGRVLLY